jgi:hypothetical protein
MYTRESPIISIKTLLSFQTFTYAIMLDPTYRKNKTLQNLIARFKNGYSSGQAKWESDFMGCI